MATKIRDVSFAATNCSDRTRERARAREGGGGGWHKASVSDCLPLAAPIGLSPLLFLTLCGPERGCGGGGGGAGGMGGLVAVQIIQRKTNIVVLCFLPPSSIASQGQTLFSVTSKPPKPT